VCICVNSAGFENGKEMTSKLPAITLRQKVGRNVTFDTETMTLRTTNNNEGKNLKFQITTS
jgi:hypothetical protein